MSYYHQFDEVSVQVLNSIISNTDIVWIRDSFNHESKSAVYYGTVSNNAFKLIVHGDHSARLSVGIKGDPDAYFAIAALNFNNERNQSKLLCSSMARLVDLVETLSRHATE